MARQVSTRQQILPMKYNNPRTLLSQGTFGTKLDSPSIPCSPKTPVHRGYSNNNLFHVQSYKIGGKRQSVLLQVRISRSYIIAVQLYIPIFSTEYLIPFNISIQNLIPADAAILEACEIGDSDQIRRLLKSRVARPNDTTLDNHTPLGVSLPSANS